MLSISIVLNISFKPALPTNNESNVITHASRRTICECWRGWAGLVEISGIY
jgi:hypothetical protein